jgi:hypothetical protein
MRSSLADLGNRQLTESMTSPELRAALVEAIPEIQGNLSTESKLRSQPGDCRRQTEPVKRVSGLRV